MGFPLTCMPKAVASYRADHDKEKKKKQMPLYDPIYVITHQKF